MIRKPVLLVRQAGIAVLLLGILAVIFWRVLVGGQTFFDGDVAMQFYAWAALLAQSLKQAHLPLWTPELGCGFPLADAAEPGVFYPLNWIFFGLLPLEPAFELHLLVHLWVAGLATYGFLRLLGSSRSAAFLGACCFMLGGAMVCRVFHSSILRTASWLPVGFWCLERGKRGSPTWIGAAGLSIGLAWLAGHPQVACYVTMTIMAYAAYCAVETKSVRSIRSWWPEAVKRAGFVGGIGLSLGAIQWLPTLQLATYSSRASAMPFPLASGFGFHPRNIITFFFPGFFGFQTPAGGQFWGKGNFWELCSYLSVLPIFFIMATWKARHQGAVRFFLGLLALSFLLMLGKYGGLVWILRWLPIFNRFKNPERWSVAFAFAASVLTAIGMDLLRQRADVRQWLWRVGRVVWMAVLSCVGLLHIVCVWGREWLQAILQQICGQPAQHGLLTYPLEQTVAKAERTVLLTGQAVSLANPEFLWSLLVVVCAGGIVWALAKTSRVQVVVVSGLILTVFDLGLFASRCLPTRSSREVFSFPSWLIELQTSQPPGRLLSLPPADDHSLVAMQTLSLMPSSIGIALANSSGSLGLLRNVKLLDAGKLANANGQLQDLGIWSLMNVAHLLSARPLHHPQLQLVRSDPYFLYTNRISLPRFYIARQLLVVPFGDDAQVMRGLHGLGGSPNWALVETSGAFPYPTADEAPQDDPTQYLLERERTPTRQRLEVQLDHPGLLVVVESWYPGWGATIDGYPSALYRVNGLFRGIWVQGGRHHVEFRYRPMVIWLGIGLSSLSLLLFAWSRPLLKLVRVLVRRKFNEPLSPFVSSSAM